MDSHLEQAAQRFLRLASRLRRLGSMTSPPQDIQTSPAHLTLIEYVALYPGCGIQEIATALKLSKPTVSIGMRQLEKNGLIARQPHPEDGRAVKIFLTPKGKETYQRAHIFHRQKFEQLLAGLTPEERNTLLDLLERAINAAENPKQGDEK